MSNFLDAIDFVLRNEGGFVDHVSDPGGATNFGVSLRTLQKLEGSNLDEWDLDRDGDIDRDDVRLMTEGLARRFYKTHFWHILYEKFTHQSVATKVFDMSVNMGSKQAIKILQHACNWSAPNQDLRTAIKVDGFIGPKTVAASNAVSDTLNYFLPSEQAKFYYTLVDAKPARSVFLLGWLRRAYHWPH